MRVFVLMAAVMSVGSVFSAIPASAQTSPRIIMRRPLAPEQAAPSAPSETCGTPGQPACPSDCAFVGAAWDVGNWSGASCGQDGVVTRPVRCVGIMSDGRRVSKPDAFCLQDASTFNSSCSNGSVN